MLMSTGFLQDFAKIGLFLRVSLTSVIIIALFCEKMEKIIRIMLFW